MYNIIFYFFISIYIHMNISHNNYYYMAFYIFHIYSLFYLLSNSFYFTFKHFSCEYIKAPEHLQGFNNIFL